MPLSCKSVRRLYAEKRLVIPIHNQSRRSSLCESLNYGRRCTNSTSL